MKYVIRRYEIKICGLTRHEDVLAAAGAGADYVGFVLVPSSKRYVAPERLAELTKDLPEHVRKVGVFADASLENILAAVKAGALDIVQLHGNEAPEYAEQLRDKGVCVWTGGTDRRGRGGRGVRQTFLLGTCRETCQTQMRHARGRDHAGKRSGGAEESEPGGP